MHSSGSFFTPMKSEKIHVNYCLALFNNEGDPCMQWSLPRWQSRLDSPLFLYICSGLRRQSKKNISAGLGGLHKHRQSWSCWKARWICCLLGFLSLGLRSILDPPLASTAHDKHLSSARRSTQSWLCQLMFTVSPLSSVTLGKVPSVIWLLPCATGTRQTSLFR